MGVRAAARGLLRCRQARGACLSALLAATSKQGRKAKHPRPNPSAIKHNGNKKHQDAAAAWQTLQLRGSCTTTTETPRGTAQHGAHKQTDTRNRKHKEKKRERKKDQAELTV